MCAVYREWRGGRHRIGKIWYIYTQLEAYQMRGNPSDTDTDTDRFEVRVAAIH